MNRERLEREPLDPRIDRMMAALYGELSESEERDFARLLESDPALATEYEELRTARSFLEGWSVEDRVPSFVIVDEPARRRAPVGRWARFTESLRGFAISPAWGLAATAAILAIVAIAGLRVEPLGNGIALRFGEPDPAPGVGPGVPLRALGTEQGLVQDAGMTTASAGYLTRDEFQAYNAQMMQSLALLLNEYSERRDGNVVDLVHTVYDRVASQQNYDFELLRSRIDVLGAELLLERSLRAEGFEELLGDGRRLRTREPLEARDLTPGNEE